MRFLARMIHFGTIAAAVLFLTTSTPSGLTGFILSIPHWPARLFRFLGVGRVLESLSIPIADVSLRIIGPHPLLQSVLVVLLAGFVLAPLHRHSSKQNVPAPRPRAGRVITLALLCLVGLSIISAWFSGMHLSRLAAGVGTSSNPSANGRGMVDLLLGAEPLDAVASERTMRRLAQISGNPALRESLEPLQNEASLRVQQTRHAWAQLWQRLDAVPRRKKQSVQAMLLMVQLANELQLPALQDLATNGRGGNNDQQWRELRFQGPLGPITVRTNFLPPDSRLITVVPEGYAEGVQIAKEDIKSAAAGFAAVSPDAPGYFALVDSIAKQFQLNDVLVRMWYTTLASYFTTRTLVQITAGSRSHLAQEDAYGELTIHLHNSCHSFTRALAGRTGDVVSAGLFLPRTNEIHVWMDERAAAQYDAQYKLGFTARLLQTLDSAGSDSLSALRLFSRLAANVPPDRIGDVLSHELVHWGVHASFSEMTWLRFEDTPAFEEGLALAFELIPMEFFRRDSVGMTNRFDARSRAILESLQEGPRDSEAERFRATTAAGCPSYEFGSPYWPCIWLHQSGHGASSPWETVVLRRSSFFDARHLRSNYGDAWALVRLFGQDILTKAVSRQVSIGQIVTADHIFATPWYVIQRDIKRGSNVPRDLTTLFEPCK